ncbi:hypothetical protein DW844_09035 [Faecalibacterium prausnitzii]|nr:hypothetical protein DW844_09035 [Faecalibacterium prausnitzii]
MWVLKSLRAFQNPFFTSGVVTGSSICSTAFFESAALPFTVRTPLVKIAFGALRRARQTRNKNNNSAEDG